MCSRSRTTPSPRACCWPTRPSVASTRSISSGTTTPSACCCGLRWIERDAAGQLVTHEVDPETTAWQRFEAGFLAGLPIDWLL